MHTSAWILTTVSLAAMPGALFAQAHPHFNDGGTLSWYTTLAEAQAAAKKADKLIFVEYGRAA
jgi:hypothetical protein